MPLRLPTSWTRKVPWGATVTPPEMRPMVLVRLIRFQVRVANAITCHLLPSASVFLALPPGKQAHVGPDHSQGDARRRSQKYL